MAVGDPLDLMARTILGEAGNQSPEGQLAVGAVIRNRLQSGRWGDTVEDVLFAPKQFEPWETRKEELMGISTEDPKYKQAYQMSESLMNGTAEDPTGGATHFLNPEVVRQRSGKTPSWYGGEGNGWQRLGDHVFGNADGGGVEGWTNRLFEKFKKRWADKQGGGDAPGENQEPGMGGGSNAPAEQPGHYAGDDWWQKWKEKSGSKGLLGEGTYGPKGGPLETGMNMLKEAEGDDKPKGLLNAPQIYRPKKIGKRGSLRSLLD